MENKIDFSPDNVDVNKIMKQIHENIKSRGYDLDELKRLPDRIGISFAQSNPLLCQRLDENLMAVNRSHFIQYWWDMPREQRVILKAKCVLKKFTRRCSYFYIKQVFDQQNIFNANAARCINDLSNYCRQLESEKNDILKKLDSVQLELSEFKKLFGNSSPSLISKKHEKE